LRKYEAVFILDARKLDDGGEEFARETAGHITELGGKQIDRNLAGRRQFARPIGKIRAGIYLNVIMELDPDKVNVLEEKYRLDNRVLRLVVLAYAPSPSGSGTAAKDERHRPRRSSRL